MKRRAIIAGHGALPLLLFKADPQAVFVKINGIEVDPPKGADVVEASFEKLGHLFSDLKSHGVEEIVMAGSMDRPALNPARFDFKMIKLAPGLLKAFRLGDDGLLRKVISIFEGEGFSIVGAADIAPHLTAPAGVIAGPKPSKELLSDSARARDILRALGGLDIGQVAIVEGGLPLGIETIQGTDALLNFVALTPDRKRSTKGGVMVKWPKPEQDLRIDMPAIGPRTVQAAMDAGLNGMLMAAGQVLIVERERVLDLANQGGFSLWAEEGAL